MRYKLVNYCENDKYAKKAYSLIHNEPESKNLGDITLVNEKEIADFNWMVGGSPCFRKGALITTNKGLVPIEEVQKDDMVLTHKNRFKKVLKSMINKTNSIYKLKIQGSPINYVTEEHPYYIREMKRVWNNEKRSYERAFSEPKWKMVKELSKNDFVGIGMNEESSNVKNLSKEECWLIGRYIADGYIRNDKRPNRENSYNHQVIFCIGKHKIEYFQSNISTYYCAINEERTAYKCRIINERLMNLCLECGKGSENKNIPQFILDLPIDYLIVFLDGYMSGDGCFTNDQFKATSVSKKLIYQLGQVVVKVYHTPYSIYFTKRKETTYIEGRKVNQRNTWTIAFNTSVRHQNNAVFIDGMLWCPVKDIEYIEDFDEDVYNFEVEDDNSYVANNCIVHNCQDFSVAGKGKGAVWTCKDCKDDEGNNYQYNPLEVHYTKRDRCPKCNSTNIEKTRSSLIVEWLRILNEKKPNIAIYENVKNLVGKKHRYFFDLFIQELHEYGYNTYWKVLNAKNYGVPQNRERVYLIIIKKELDNGKFKFPKGFDNGIRLKDILEKEVDEKYYISQDKVDKLIKQLKDKEYSNTVRTGGHGSTDRHMWDLVAVEDNSVAIQINRGEIKTKEDNICSCIDANYHKGLDNHASRTGIMQVGMLDIKGSEQIRRVYDPDGLSPTLDTMQGGNRQPKILEDFYANRDIREYEEYSPIAPTQTTSCDRSCSSATVLIKDIWYRIRKLIPLECFRLMGFKDKDFYILKENGISDTQCYKMAGNSIVVDVLYYIYLELYKAMPYLFDDIKLGSFFSGIGAFEKAIKRLLKEINQNELSEVINN